MLMPITRKLLKSIFLNLIICFTIDINKHTLSLIPPQHTQQIFHMGQKDYTHPFTNTMLHTFIELNRALNLKSHFQLTISVHDFSSGISNIF